MPSKVGYTIKWLVNLDSCILDIVYNKDLSVHTYIETKRFGIQMNITMTIKIFQYINEIQCHKMTWLYFNIL